MPPAYGAELAHLKISDIDSQRMVIHIQGGKGRRDRDVMLSPNLLEALRQHYRSLRKKPATWLFPGGVWHTADRPIETKVVWHACREAAQRAGLDKSLHPHTLGAQNTQRLITLTVDEFIRRFLLHLLPPGFVRIRYFGIFAHRQRRLILPLCSRLLATSPLPRTPSPDALRPLWRCPNCGGSMVVLERLSSIDLRLRSPPVMASQHQ